MPSRYGLKVGGRATPRSSQADGHASILVTSDVVWPPVGTITQKAADGATNLGTYIWDWTPDADFAKGGEPPTRAQY